MSKKTIKVISFLLVLVMIFSFVAGLMFMF